MALDTATEQLRSFLLASSKNAEQFPDELLDAINVATELDSILSAAVERGHDVVIAGTAGSGKTHLLSRLAAACKYPLVRFGSEEPRRGKFVRVVEDLTALEEKDELRVFDRVKHCHAIVVAANEGALIGASRRDDNDRGRRPNPYAVAVEYLHGMQQGAVISGSSPVVIDAAGYDPASSEVVERLLALPALERLVCSRPTCSCEDTECPRQRAWKLMMSKEVRQRLAALVNGAARGAEGFTFRQLWHFIADLALGGNCAEGADGEPPSSPWFYRVYAGTSQVSSAIRDTYPLIQFPMPGIDARIWYGDWDWLEALGSSGSPSVRMLVPIRPPQAVPQALAYTVFEWVRSQILFTSSRDYGERSYQPTALGSLWSAVVNQRVPELIRAINHYMTYGMGPASAELEMWCDLSVERRSERPDAQASIGRVPASDFSVARSLIAANPSCGVPMPAGHRFFLRHEKSGAVLPLTRSTVGVISAGRSARMADRQHTETDWLLMRFFARIGTTEASVNRLRVACFNFLNRDYREYEWDVYPALPKLQLVR